MSIPQDVMAEAKVKWPAISNKTKVYLCRWSVLEAPKRVGQSFTVIRLTPAPLIGNWDADYNDEVDCLVFRILPDNEVWG